MLVKACSRTKSLVVRVVVGCEDVGKAGSWLSRMKAAGVAPNLAVRTAQGKARESVGVGPEADLVRKFLSRRDSNQTGLYVSITSEQNGEPHKKFARCSLPRAKRKQQDDFLSCKKAQQLDPILCG